MVMAAPSHVDGGTQRDGNRVSVLANTKTLTQLHVYGNVSGRAASKEGVHAGVFYATEYDGVGVLANVDEHQQRVYNEADEEHGAPEEQGAAGRIR